MGFKKDRQKQLSLPIRKFRREHGGEDHAGKRKRERPIDPQGSLHVTMRSSHAQGERSMLHPKRFKLIRARVYSAGRRHGVIVERYVNVGNHLHLHLRTKSYRAHLARPAVAKFLKEVGGVIARIVTGAKKGVPAGIRGRFWDYLAWSRVMRNRLKELRTLAGYLRKNERDAANVIIEQGWPEACLDFADPG